MLHLVQDEGLPKLLEDPLLCASFEEYERLY